MAEPWRKELPHPWQVDFRYLCDLIERRIAATGYRLRKRGYVGEMEIIYNNSMKVVLAINTFLESPEDDYDEMLEALVDLNIGLRYYRFPVARSRRFRERLENHIGWTAELAEARPPTDDERGILDRLFKVNFLARDEVRDQIQGCLVKTVDENGSLSLYPKKPAKVAVASAMPVWGEVRDDDGVTIHVRLHVIQGFVKELEIVKEDDSRVIRPLKANDLTVHQVS